MRPKELIEYRSTTNKVPFREWLFSKKIDHRTKARILVRLHSLCLGHAGDSKPVGAGVWELKFHFGPGYRVYYAYVSDVIILLLVGGDKASQRQDIQVAKRYWEEFLRRNKYESSS
jgi:putative addiction module killer protein